MTKRKPSQLGKKIGLLALTLGAWLLVMANSAGPHYRRAELETKGPVKHDFRGFYGCLPSIGVSDKVTKVSFLSSEGKVLAEASCTDGSDCIKEIDFDRFDREQPLCEVRSEPEYPEYQEPAGEGEAPAVNTPDTTSPEADAAEAEPNADGPLTNNGAEPDAAEEAKPSTNNAPPVDKAASPDGDKPDPSTPTDADAKKPVPATCKVLDHPGEGKPCEGVFKVISEKADGTTSELRFEQTFTSGGYCGG